MPRKLDLKPQNEPKQPPVGDFPWEPVYTPQVNRELSTPICSIVSTSQISIDLGLYYVVFFIREEYSLRPVHLFPKGTAIYEDLSIQILNQR